MAMTGAFATVAIPSPLRRAFDYAIPRGLGDGLTRGCRVLVPFARTRQVGVVLARHDEPAVAVAKVRSITEVLDAQPLLDEVTVKLLEWASGYYHHPIGEVMQSALPTLLRRATSGHARGPKQWTMTAAGAALPLDSLNRAPRQADALRLLAEHPGLARAELEALTPGAGAGLVALQRKGLVEACEQGEVLPALTPVLGFELNPEQHHAVQALTAARAFEVFLLDGVTGSGKTEVYLQFAAAVLARGQQVLVLVPEIGLTPQMITRFRRRLGATLVVLHSGLAAAARRNAWLAAQSGRADVVLGTRSSVFTPMPRLGGVIVDEEHDLSYKQQDGFRYSARDVALVRARMADTPIVLGSATPALESLYNTTQARSTRLVLRQRAGVAVPPHIEIVDIRAARIEGHISPGLLRAIEQTLAAKAQVLLFVNRRGFAPALICHECGAVHDCPRCDARMVLHRAAGVLRCHHCGRETRTPRACGECESTELRPVGLGTERLEQELSRRFPGATIDRIDRDTTRKRGTLEASLDSAHSGSTQILVGTQMLAKGHDFPGVTLVGILDADSGLFSTDFRASERLAQLILQVAGRAGRAERPGRVLIQTHQPEHPLLHSLVRASYAEFASMALQERQEAGFPPYAALALLRAEAPLSEACTAFLIAAAQLARQYNSDYNLDVDVLGPVPAPMERRQGRHRAQLLFRADTRAPLHRLLRPFSAQLETMALARKVRWSLDVDPQDMT
jgi:primosomal protein N' (replication factor Y) (superfamily II helicase)